MFISEHLLYKIEQVMRQKRLISIINEGLLIVAWLLKLVKKSL